MKKNKTYKRFDSDTYRRVMSILIYLESIEVKSIVRHVNHSKVYYRVSDGFSYKKLDDISKVMKNLPKRYVVAFDTFMGKVFKRVLRRVHTFYRDEYYSINFLMKYLQDNSYIVPIGLEDIECVRMYAENLYDKVDVLKLVDSLLAKKSEVENILDDTEVVNKNTTLDTERLGKNFTYLKETLLRLYMKGYNTIEVGDNIIAVVQDYTQNDVDNHTIKRKTYLNITSIFDLLDLYRPLRRGVYSIKDILNSCDKKEGEKMKVVHTKETNLVRSNESRNLMLAKDLALEFIDSGYDVIMRDGDDLVVYSNTDTSMQEYVPKSLHNVFYDVDKLDLLPLSYYVYMCK